MLDKPPSVLKDYRLAIRNNLQPDAVPTIFQEVHSKVKAGKESEFGPPKTKRIEYGTYKKINEKRASAYPNHFYHCMSIVLTILFLTICSKICLASVYIIISILLDLLYHYSTLEFRFER